MELRRPSFNPYSNPSEDDMRIEPEELALNKTDERSLTITIVRTSIEQTTPQRYQVTRRGVINSLRIPQDMTVRIGRQHINEEGLRPNDITLPPSDRAISRCHCMIECKKFFIFEIPDEWIAFLMAYHPRLGRNSIWNYLPLDLFRYILMFIKEPRAPYLVDLGSMCGTYVKVSNSEPVELEQGQNFLIGSDIIIEIDRVANDPVPPSLNSEQTLEDTGQNTFNSSDMMIEDIGPYILIRVCRSLNDNEETINASTWKFAAEEKYKSFTIGRSQICDIQLSENTISRTQCRVIYDEGKWLLYDGLVNKPTINGTWMSVFKKERVNREHSLPFKLKNGSQVKVSDTILQVDWIE